MKQTTIKKLNEVKTLNDYLNFLQSEFKTAECKPGRFVKSTVIHLLITKLNGQNLIVTEAIKQKALEATSIEHFIKIVQDNFNTNQLFSLGALGNLVSDTNKLTALTGLKENEQSPDIKEVKPDTEKKKIVSRRK